ncbi:MAG TPA: RNA polymerase sigma factor [Candidatus Limnocylindrales bacterium]|nr:RNA polymerase sigma factor [Candidatus Limnocylindrales bacterium]
MTLAALAGADAEALSVATSDTDGFAVLYDRYAGQLFRYAYQRAGDAAQDIVADTFLAAFQQRASFDPGRGEVRPWLFGILTRKLARYHRAEKARYLAFARAAGQGIEANPDERVTETVSAAAMRAPLAAALARLSPGDRDVLLLVAWADCSYEEVAGVLDIPIGTVRSRLNRARRKVRQALGEEGIA